MKVTLSKNSKQITSIDYKATDPFTGITVRSALACLENQFSKIPDAVIYAFILQERRPENKSNIKYIADVNKDVWTIYIETPLCRECGEIEVDNEDDLCRECR